MCTMIDEAGPYGPWPNCQSRSAAPLAAGCQKGQLPHQRACRVSSRLVRCCGRTGEEAKSMDWEKGRESDNVVEDGGSGGGGWSGGGMQFGGFHIGVGGLFLI